MANLEFPDFDYPLPVIEGFEDSSWHNDVCPSLTREASDPSQTLILWCDYANPALREDEARTRYTLIKGEYGAVLDQTILYEGESLDEALVAIARATSDSAIA